MVPVIGNTFIEKYGPDVLKKMKYILPRLDYVVDMGNCYYYMFLLESFYNINFFLGPEHFKLYILAAERRCLEFIRTVGKENTFERTCNVK